MAEDVSLSKKPTTSGDPAPAEKGNQLQPQNISLRNKHVLIPCLQFTGSAVLSFVILAIFFAYLYSYLGSIPRGSAPIVF
jgi:hypothetical protein